MIFNGYLQVNAPGPLLAEFYDTGGDYGLDISASGLDFIGDGSADLARIRNEDDGEFKVGPTGGVTITPSDGDTIAAVIKSHADWQEGEAAGDMLDFQDENGVLMAGFYRHQVTDSRNFFAYDDVNADASGFYGSRGMQVYVKDAAIDNPILITNQDGSEERFKVGPTGAVTISPSDPDAIPLTLGGLGEIHTPRYGMIVGDATLADPFGSVGFSDNVTHPDNNGDGIRWVYTDTDGEGRAVVQIAGDYIVEAHAGKLGFFATPPVVKPTGVAVTDAGIHAALVDLGLIAA